MKNENQSEIETVRPPKFLRQPPAPSGTYSTKPYVVNVEDLNYEDELTPVFMACLACKGRGTVSREVETSYSEATCRWCSNGTMSGLQINDYLNRDQVKARFIDDELRRYVEE